jgi:hypothetical protein
MLYRARAEHDESGIKQRDMTSCRARLALLAMAVAACAGNTPGPQTPGARAVVLSEAAPPAGYVEVQSVSAHSGKGCGVFGETGSRERAETKLRDEAAKLRATYVRITSVQAPGINHECVEHEYKLNGVAYRNGTVPTLAPPSATVASPATPTPAPAVRVCVPGATQACLGPGACPGAQACREDASAFLPCDCGTGPNAPAAK